MRFALAGLAAAMLGWAAPAGAASLTLSCPGDGGQRSAADGRIVCGVLPGRTLTVSGLVRDDAGRPVGAPIALTPTRFVDEAGGSFVEDDGTPTTVRAGADGRFGLQSDPRIIERWTAYVATDPALGIFAPATAVVEVRRRLVTSIAKLGAGRVRVSVDGLQGAVEIRVLSRDGRRLHGVAPRRITGGRATTFRLGHRTGTFQVRVVDLARGGGYWAQPGPTFRLRRGA